MLVMPIRRLRVGSLLPLPLRACGLLLRADASAATIPGVWSAPLSASTARVVIPHADEYSPDDVDTPDEELEEGCGSLVLCYCEWV